MTINDCIDRLKLCGFTFGESILNTHVQNAKEQMEIFMRNFITDPVWLEDYDEIADWLTDNKGKGLLLIGGVGVGKTFMVTKVISPILLLNHSKLPHFFSAHDMNKQEQEIESSRILVLDDIGVEDMKNDYGEKRSVFADIVDRAERRGDLLIITTNLLEDELLLRYDNRTVDRLKAITRWVALSGTSFRK